MRDVAIFAIALSFGIIGLLLILAYGEANPGYPTLAITNVDTPSDEECATWESTAPNFGIEWTACTAAANQITLYEASSEVGSFSGIDFEGAYINVTSDGTTGTIDVDSTVDWPNATTATALAANGTNCSANQFNKGVDASGNAESCAALGDADVPDTITIDLAATATALAANGTNCSAGNYPLGVDASGNAESCTAASAGSTIAIALDSSTIDDAVSGLDWASPFLVSTTGTTGSIDLDTSGTWSGNAGTATALASNPTDCAANQFANAIAASGNLTCAAIADADVPDTITIDLAATATALASDPSDCAANTFAQSIAASGNLTCASVDLGTADATGTLDVSDHLNLTAGRSLTLTGDDVAADAELYTASCSISIVSASTTLDQNLVCGPPNALALTVTRLFCITETGTASYTVDERTRASIYGSGTAVEAAENLNCNSSGVTVSAGIDNAGIAAGSSLVVSVPTISSDGINLTIILDGTWDD